MMSPFPRDPRTVSAQIARESNPRRASVSSDRDRGGHVMPYTAAQGGCATLGSLRGDRMDGAEKRRRLRAISDSANYLSAFEDVEFLRREDLWPVRLQHGVLHTV